MKTRSHNVSINLCFINAIEAGQFWTGTQCKSCHDSCETCSDFSDQNCLSCRSPTMFQAPGTCVEQCSAGFYPDLRFGNYATCQPCPHPCIECVSRTNCTMCHSPLLLQTGQCRTTCAPGYVLLQTCATSLHEPHPPSSLFVYI